MLRGLRRAVTGREGRLPLTLSAPLSVRLFACLSGKAPHNLRGAPYRQAGHAAVELGRDSGQHRALFWALGPRADIQVLPLTIHAAAAAN